jgi:two-component system chemotaxis response regulator CheY
MSAFLNTPPRRVHMKKVLLVDDSISVARQIEKILVDSGEFQVLGHAKNGLEALKMFQSLQPDIICMDMNMPGMDGITALRTLMALDKNVKVVMITSLGGVGEKFNEAIKLGAKNVISKPFESENVLKILRQL